MDTVLLEVFREVSRLGSYTAAAKSLGYTQSAVSRQVATLESALGAVLFDRRARGVALTEFGRQFLPHACAVLDRLSVAGKDLADLRDQTTGRLRIGSFATAGVSLVPQAITAYRRDHPAIELSHIDGLTRDLTVSLERDDIDLAVINGYPEQIANLRGLSLSHLLDEAILVALPREHRLAGRRRLRLRDLAAESWIAGSSSPQETLISAALRQGFQPEIAYVVREWTAKQGFVAAGLGVTLIPAIAMASVRDDVALVRLHPEDTPIRGIYAATRAGTATVAATGFTRQLRRTVAALRVGEAER